MLTVHWTEKYVYDHAYHLVIEDYWSNYAGADINPDMQGYTISVGAGDVQQLSEIAAIQTLGLET